MFKKKKKKKHLIIGVLIIAIGVVLIGNVIGALSLFMESSMPEDFENNTNTDYSDMEGTWPEAFKWRSEVEKACRKFNNEACKKQCGNLDTYVNLALATMCLESGNDKYISGTDPMQASLCGFNKRFPHNGKRGKGITDPIYSIECGVQYMRNAIITAKVESPTDYGHIANALQGYNYGVDNWCSWISKNGDVYSIERAEYYRTNVLHWCQNKGYAKYGADIINLYKQILAGGSAKKGNSNEIVTHKGYSEFSESDKKIVRRFCGGNDVGAMAALFAIDKVGMPYSQALRTDGKHYDCSSLAYYAWMSQDILIGGESPPTAADEGKWLSDKNCSVSRKSLKPGDLIFYGKSGNGRWKGINHVAIWIGDNYIVQAAGVKTGVTFGVDRHNISKIVFYARPSLIN